MSRNTLMIALLASLFVQVRFAQAQNSLTPQQALDILGKPATSEAEYVRADARIQALQVLRQAPDVAPLALAETLERALSNRDNPSRLGLLELACARADTATAPIVVAAVNRFGEEYIGITPISVSPKLDQGKVLDSAIMKEFLAKQAGILAEHMSDKRPLFEMFYGWVLHKEIRRSLPLGGEICRAIATVPAPVSLRREFVTKIFDNYDFWGHGVPEELVEVLDEPLWERLRTQVTDWQNGPRPFPDAVAQLLADRGDLKVLPAMNKIEKTRFSGEVLKGREPEEVPCTLSWRIRVQNPPTNLLVWLAKGPPESPSDRIDQNDRMWMIRRAVELGLDRERIRQAVLQYAELYQKAGKRPSMELPSVKRVAVDLGILKPDDLPTVALPDPGAKRNQAG